MYFHKSYHQQFNPKYAITDGMFATIFNGRRLVKHYRSGEKLQGFVEN